MNANIMATAGARLGMPFSVWPATDQSAWTAAFEAKRPVPGQPSGARLRGPTKLLLATCYARWLLWLSQNDVIALAHTPGARATEDRVIDYLHDLHGEVCVRTVLSYACGLRRSLELMAPEQDRAWFAPLVKNVKRYVNETPAKRRPFVPSDQLFAFGLEIMDAASIRSTLPLHARAEAFRNGLAIAFLAARPLRLKNMVELEIAVHFIECQGGYRVELPPDRTKNRRWLAFPMPMKLTRYIRAYLADYRPALAGNTTHSPENPADDGKLLFPGRKGGPFAVATFEDMTCRLTLERFKQRLTPHDFRHCVATSIAQFNPADYQIIRVILGHATSATADQHYIHAKAIEAAHQAQAVVQAARKAAEKLARTSNKPSSSSKPEGRPV